MQRSITGRTRFGVVGFRLARSASLVAVALLAAVAVAFAPPGAELLITDADGRRFLGVGTFDAGGLHLDLAERTTPFLAVRVDPDGSARTYHGRWRDGRLELREAGGPWTDLAALLAEDDRAFWLRLPGGEPVRIPAAPPTADEGAGAEPVPVPTDDVEGGGVHDDPPTRPTIPEADEDAHAPEGAVPDRDADEDAEERETAPPFRRP